MNADIHRTRLSDAAGASRMGLFDVWGISAAGDDLGTRAFAELRGSTGVIPMSMGEQDGIQRTAVQGCDDGIRIRRGIYHERARTVRDDVDVILQRTHHQDLDIYAQAFDRSRSIHIICLPW